MKKRSCFSGQLINRTNTQKFEVKIHVLEYQEDGIFYAYSPALDLAGYGMTAQEARDSWQTVLEEYITYTSNKKTLKKDLENRGWTVRSKNQFTSPSFTWLLQNNKELSNIYNNHNFRKVTQPISVPFAYA